MGEGELRLGVFLIVLALLLVAERWRPWRQARPLGMRRWPGNFGLLALGAIAQKLLLPIAAIGVAAWAERQAFGLLHVIQAPLWVAVPLAFVALDLAIYWQHRLTHAVPWLWRLHRVHHADPELDATSALRFHPIELLGSMLLKMAVVLVLGAPPVAVLLFEVTLNATAMFNHAAVALPARLSRVLGWVLVTPDMHRIHHSERAHETDSCFGFCLPWWDWWFGTFRAQAEDKLVLGLRGWRDSPNQRLDVLLLQPFARSPRVAGPVPVSVKSRPAP